MSIAEETKKPLLLYPAGELGLSLGSIQSGIKTIVRCASRWKAILLIDEADVFLESRESGGQANLERNALVAGIQPKPLPFISFPFCRTRYTYAGFIIDARPSFP